MSLVFHSSHSLYHKDAEREIQIRQVFALKKSRRGRGIIPSPKFAKGVKPSKLSTRKFEAAILPAIQQVEKFLKQPLYLFSPT